MRLVNLTLLKVNEEVENFLVSYPDLIDRTKLQDPNFRPKLVAYVLNRIPNRHVAIEPQNEASIFSQLSIYSTQEQLNIEKQIYQGIFSITKAEQKLNFDYLNIKFNHNN